jgi:hypothetical protein
MISFLLRTTVLVLCLDPPSQFGVFAAPKKQLTVPVDFAVVASITSNGLPGGVVIVPFET